MKEVGTSIHEIKRGNTQQKKYADPPLQITAVRFIKRTFHRYNL